MDIQHFEKILPKLVATNKLIAFLHDDDYLQLLDF